MKNIRNDEASDKCGSTCATPCLLDFSSTTKAAMHGIYPWLTMDKSTNTQTYWNLDCKMMEGLNKLYLHRPYTWDHEYPSMHGLIQPHPVGPGPSSRHRIQWGSLTYKQWYAPTVTLLTQYFHVTPYISKKTLFLPKIVSQSPLFFPHCPKLLEIFSLVDP